MTTSPPMSSRRRLLLLLLLAVLAAASAEPVEDKAALLSFITQTRHLNRVQWNSSASACTWTGVTCDPSSTAVVSLRLPAVGLVGPIPPATLGRLRSLRVLSLRSNALSGPVPSDFSNLTLLYSLYLQNNLLSGPFPPELAGLTRLSHLDLAGNNFSGSLPFSVNNLTRLSTLNLERNSFSGPIPSINIGTLKELNVSYNNLNGSIPETLSSFPQSSFAGNLQLCGAPLPPCPPFFPSPSPSPSAPTEPPPPAGPAGNKKKKKLSTAAIVGIVVGAFLLISLIILLCICLLLARERKRKDGRPSTKPGPTPPPAVRSTDTGMTSSSKEELSGVVEAERNRLNFVGGGGGYSFDLEDLLRASAEVLGKGSFGTSYKAVLEEGTTVVVKRLKDVAVSKREFEVQMEELGRIDHRNLLPLRAYYYSKDEKLLVFDYLPAGSLSSVLHGSRGSGRAQLDWDNRMRIALAVGRGLSHLHNSARTVHGNVKASNVLLRPDLDSAALSDYALGPLFSSASAPSNRTAGYRAPEVVETRRPTLKSDVYSFGVLLLELLTGKTPDQALLGDEGIDLPRWVQSVVREEWTAEVFDSELMQYPNIEEEMVQLLQIAMACVATMPDSRPEVSEAVKMMEEIVNRAASESEGVGGASSDDPSKGGTSGGRTRPPPPAASSTP
ncbi:putative inactive receptor kinase [Iris pallida]|uniref:Inactive receptor kinase n=1 Tax=Iris pallida TaxID=29817 RepID=A0AAX6F2P3_IRIPA|nr:putative inactive receptor kinase [Iris pallida]